MWNGNFAIMKNITTVINADKVSDNVCTATGNFEKNGIVIHIQGHGLMYAEHSHCIFAWCTDADKLFLQKLMNGLVI
jgi:hypothetical protein